VSRAAQLGPHRITSVREAAPRGVALTSWDVSAIWPRDLARARADQEVIVEGAWELAGLAGLRPCPKRHFRDHCFAWPIRLQGCIKQQAGVSRPIKSCWATFWAPTQHSPAAQANEGKGSGSLAWVVQLPNGALAAVQKTRYCAHTAELWENRHM
jgi:hypothetical protein